MLLIDTGHGSMEYLSAGHVPFVVVGPDRRGQPIDSTGWPLGLLSGSVQTIRHLSFAPGSTLIVVTDGVTERRRGTIEYGIARLLAAGSRLARRSARRAVDELLADNDGFADGNAADDDLTIVVVRFLGAVSPDRPGVHEPS